jgi:N-acetylglucosamine malate deacetylase 1
MRHWSWFSSGMVLGLVVAAAFGFSRSGESEPQEAKTTFAGQPVRPDDGKLGVIVFGAHPDDAEIRAGGSAALWSDLGHHVKFVSMTNGDIGHWQMAGGPLAQRRNDEVQQAAKILGTTTEVLDIHDGELMPTLENRRTVARLIREWQADIVLAHRPNDYHADHRYTGVLVDDAAVLVVAPFFTPDTPPTPRNPIFLYYSDNFQKPTPFEPTIVVGIDRAAEQKWSCISAMPSQFGDEGSWQAMTRPDVPRDPVQRPAYLLDLVKQRNAAVADQYRDRLTQLYGAERARAIRYAEAFELSQYGSQASVQQLLELFPTRP